MTQVFRADNSVEIAICLRELVNQITGDASHQFVLVVCKPGARPESISDGPMTDSLLRHCVDTIVPMEEMTVVGTRQ